MIKHKYFVLIISAVLSLSWVATIINRYVMDKVFTEV